MDKLIPDGVKSLKGNKLGLCESGAILKGTIKKGLSQKRHLS